MKVPTFPPRLEEWVPRRPPALPVPKWMHNPHFVVAESGVVTVDSELDQMSAAKEQELVARGVPPGLARRAVRWAQEYAHGLTTMMATPTAEVPVVYRRALTYGLAKAEDWARGILKAIGM